MGSNYFRWMLVGAWSGVCNLDRMHSLSASKGVGDGSFPKAAHLFTHHINFIFVYVKPSGCIRPKNPGPPPPWYR